MQCQQHWPLILFIYLFRDLFIIGFIAHTKLQMESTRVANKVNSVAKSHRLSLPTYSVGRQALCVYVLNLLSHEQQL